MAANIPNNPVAIQKFFTSRDNNANATTYVGQEQRLWYDPVTNAIYVSDGNTAGGIAVGSSGSGNGVPGGAANTVQYNVGNGSFGGDPNFTFNSSTSTLTITNIVTNTLTGGAGGSNTQVQFNDSGNINGNSNFTYNKASNALTMTGSAFLGNVYAQANNASNLGSPTRRFNDLWLGSGNINLIDDTLNINQQINAQNGNLVISGGNGLVFGEFAMYGNTIATTNAASNITVGYGTDTGYFDINRPVAVNSEGGGLPAFLVEKDGTVEIRSYGNIAANSAALAINATTSGNSQPRNFEGTLIQATAQDNTPGRMAADAFGVDGSGQNAYVSWAARVARGNINAPSQTLAGDTMFRFTSQGWSNSGSYVGTIIRYNQVALENFAAGKAGTRHNFMATPVGTGTIKNIANIDGNGISFSNAAVGGISNVGITFTDGSYQNTAYLPTSTVGSATAATGIGIAPINTSATGNITITNTGVITVAGTPQQVYVNGNTVAANGTITLSLPQDIATNSNPTFNNLTVGNLSIIGNVSNVIPSVVSGKIIYVANTATQLSDINNSGLATGNIANGFYAAILYETTSNTWTFNSGNSQGITAGNVYGNSGQFLYQAHVGYANATIDYPDASIQADCNTDSYNQNVLQNHNQGANASGDFVAVANNGDDGNYYIDMGINSNVYNNADYAVTAPNDGYLYVNGGNLAIGTQTAAKVINFFTGGTNSTSYLRGTLSDTGLSMTGNVTADNVIGVTAAIGGLVTASGNITGGNLVSSGLISAQGNLVALNINTGIISATGNITGANLRTSGSISTTANVVAGNLITSGLISSAGNIAAANIAAGNITSGIISATGNISGPNVIATILQVSSLLSVSGNITGGNLLTDGIVSTTGNITGNYFLGNGSQLTGITLPRIANGTSNISIATASGNATVGIGGTPNIAVFATTGEYVTGVISATGNITGNYFIGNGSQLTGLNAYGNVYANGTAVLAGNGSATLTVTPGNNQVITGNNTSKVVTIAVNDNPTFANVSVTGNITVNGNIVTANTTYIANVGNILFSNTSPLPTAQPGVMEYDGRVLYFTGQDQERGIVPNQQFYVLQDDRGLTYGSTAPQSLFGVGAHVSNSGRYWFRIKATVSRAAGTNNTAFTLGWRGSAVLSKISYTVQSSIGTAATVKTSYMYENVLVANFTNQLSVTTNNNPPDVTDVLITGIIDVGASGAGYVEPYIGWTGAVAAGSVTVSSLSNFQIYPLGVTGANTNVGNWQ